MNELKTHWDRLDAFATPLQWPRPARRAFLLTLPVSYPLWMAACFALTGWAVAAGMVNAVAGWRGADLGE